MPASTADRRGLVLLAAFLGWMFDGLEMGIFPLVARPALQQMGHGLGRMDDAFIGHWTGIINGLFLLGAAVGGLGFGWLGDRIGRVRAMSLSILCYSIFTALAFFVQTPLQFGLLRFVAALGMGGEWSLGVALVMEVWPENRRPALASWLGTANNLGMALIGLVGLFFSVTILSWRWVVLIGAVPALLTVVLRRFVPESERWKQAAAGGTGRPLREIFRRPVFGRTALAAVLGGVALIGTWGSVLWLPLWADQLAGPGLPRAKAATQVLCAVGSACGGFCGGWLGQLLGRRPAYFLICVLSLLSCACLFRGIGAYGAPFLILAFVVGVCTAAFYGWLPLYLPELFPTRMRATAQGIGFNFGRILAACGALEMGALMQTFSGSYARAGAVVTLIYAVGMIAIWFGPETRGRPLPD
jgi:SHS family sialic acid transporter-like MFS transporter